MLFNDNALLLNEESLNMQRHVGLLIAVLMCLAGRVDASELSEVVGDWRTVRHGADVNIVDCGDGSPCGFLVSVSSDVKRGHTRDVKNHDPDLRERPLDGLPILWGYAPKENGWAKGRLYNPETGQTFRSSLVLISRDELRVKGCLGPFCRQQTWTRINKTKLVSPQQGAQDE